MEATFINNAIKKVGELFNEINLSLEETKRIRKELYKKKLFIIF